jgi:hypothetical protein
MPYHVSEEEEEEEALFNARKNHIIIYISTVSGNLKVSLKLVS